MKRCKYANAGKGSCHGPLRRYAFRDTDGELRVCRACAHHVTDLLALFKVTRCAYVKLEHRNDRKRAFALLRVTEVMDA